MSCLSACTSPAIFLTRVWCRFPPLFASLYTGSCEDGVRETWYFRGVVVGGLGAAEGFEGELRELRLEREVEGEEGGGVEGAWEDGVGGEEV